MRAFWDLLTHAVATAPDWWAPMLAAWLFAGGLTQYVKQNWLREDLPPKVRHHVTQLVAIASALLISFLLWPARLPWQTGAIVGAIVGLWTPASYALLARFVWHRWPWLGERLSGDKPTPEH